MTTPYIHERQSEYWTSRQVEEFFLDNGFELLTFPLTQRTEKSIPTDFIFFDRNNTKLFGFQYKALYRNGRDFWQLNSVQHRRLSVFPWIYYCLSEMRNARDYRASLHLARIVNPRFEYQERIFPTGDGRMEFYSRWGAFYQGLQKCTNGVLVQSQRDLIEILNPDIEFDLTRELTESLVDVFLTDFASRRAVHLSPQLRDIAQ